MARIKIEDVRADAERSGWKLLSDIYYNLQEPMLFTCPHGHEVKAGYGQMRNKWACPTCFEQNLVYIPHKTIPTKESGVLRVLALDDATKVTGWSLYDGHALVGYGEITASGDDPIARMSYVRKWLLGMIEKIQPDVVAIEDIQLTGYRNAYGHAEENVMVFKRLAQLQGVLLTTLYEEKVPCNIVHTSTWRSYCGIKARTRTDQKRAARRVVEEWYGLRLGEDTAEAILLGKYAAEKHIKETTWVEWG